MYPYIDFFDSPLGIIQLKADDEFIYEVDFLDYPDRIEQKGIENDITRQCKIEISQYFEGTRTNFNIPTKPTGTTFQHATWDHIKKIPYGETINYQKLSHLLGNPKTIRAAASANGKNPILLIIPCHRVIGKNGEMTGYKRSIWRKKWLLDHEIKYSKGLLRLFDI